MRRRSKRRSSTSPSPPEPIFFVDADFSDKLFHEILEAAGVRAFMLIGDPYPNPPGRRSAFTQDLAENFVRTLPQVLRFLRRHPSPWIAKLYRPPTLEDPPSPGQIKMWLTLQEWLKQR